MRSQDVVTILMVDDQLAKLLSYEAMLANLEVHLITATTGREALALLLKHEIAVVLMDVSMPEIDGFELAELIRQHPRYQKTAIIFISGVHLTEHDRIKGYSLGAVDYLPVPVVPEILRAKVSVFVELYRKTRQLEELNRDLEQRVAERTGELQIALQARDDFLAVAAHELKTPLTSLRITTQMIMRRLEQGKGPFPAWLPERMHLIDSQSERLTRLIEQVLDISRLDQHKITLTTEPTDLRELALRLTKVMQTRTNQHKLSVIGEAGLLAEVDAGSIEQILTNLLDNAIKYSPEGGEIALNIAASSEGTVRLSVRDHGLGIPPEKRETIFARFYQAHTQDHRSGLGLGLYIAHQLVSLHGGTIGVEFPDDGGSCFIISLPRSQSTGRSRAESDEAPNTHQ